MYIITKSPMVNIENEKNKGTKWPKKQVTLTGINDR